MLRKVNVFLSCFCIIFILVSAVAAYEGPEYRIVEIEKGVNAAGLDAYWVLTDEFDYSTDAYRKQIKAIITDVAYKANTIDLIVNVVTDRDVIEVETNMYALEEHGQNWYKQALEKENKHWLVWYTGGIDRETNKRSKDASAYTIDWFIAVYTGEDVTFEQWKPDFAN